MDNAALTPAEIESLRVRCWRSPVEYARIFHPNWFPTKMPWVHRGLCALRVQRADFLLDFGEEEWPSDIRKGTKSAWTVDDVVKIVTNFVVVTKAAVKKDGVVIEPEQVAPIFRLEYDDNGTITGIFINDVKDNEDFILPRGYSKTTLINMLNERSLVYKEELYILYVSETSTHADNQLITVKRELENNALLRMVFGDLVPDRQSSYKWTDHEIEPTNGTRMESVGQGGQIRGKSKGAQRPTRIVVDDFQDAETIRKSDTQREKDLRWFLQVLLPARDILGPDDEDRPRTRMDVIGTLPHKEAVIALLNKDPDWTSVRFGARDRQGQMLWEWAVDEAKLAKLRAMYERMGQLDVFELEYNSLALDDEGAAFPVDKIIYTVRPQEWFIAKAVVADPAISDNPLADHFALACIGMGRFGDIAVVDFFSGTGVPVEDQVDKFFDMHFAHCLDLPPDQVKHGVEANAYQRALVSLITSAMHERSKTWGQRAFFEVTPIVHGKKDGAKVLRVNGILAPRVRARKLSMPVAYGSLLSQMQEWPNGRKDGPDVLAMGIQLLDPYAAAWANVANENGEAVNVAQMAASGTLFKGKQWRKAP